MEISKFVKDFVWYEQHPRPKRDPEVWEGLGLSYEQYHTIKNTAIKEIDKIVSKDEILRGDTKRRAVAKATKLLPYLNPHKAPEDWFESAVLFILESPCNRRPKGEERAA